MTSACALVDIKSFNGPSNQPTIQDPYPDYIILHYIDVFWALKPKWFS